MASATSARLQHVKVARPSARPRGRAQCCSSTRRWTWRFPALLVERRVDREQRRFEDVEAGQPRARAAREHLLHLVAQARRPSPPPSRRNPPPRQDRRRRDLAARAEPPRHRLLLAEAAVQTVSSPSRRVFAAAGRATPARGGGGRRRVAPPSVAVVGQDLEAAQDHLLRQGGMVPRRRRGGTGSPRAAASPLEMLGLAEGQVRRRQLIHERAEREDVAARLAADAERLLGAM